VTGPHIADHPKFRLPSTGGHEFASLTDLTVWIPVGANSPMNSVQRKPSEGKQAQRQGQWQRAGGESSAEGPLVFDYLIRRYASRRESDIDCDYLTFTARAIAEGGDLSALGASGCKVAGNG